ncbi:MAG: 50S ribosomal protein L29 [Chloroflexi bacterium]|nr:50S ribosomal protein L29 [Chloroflexota bacterium]
MTAQETTDLRALPSDELQQELDESLRALFNLRFQAATRQLADVSQVRRARRRVARVRTLLREREILAAIAGNGEAPESDADEGERE